MISQMELSKRYQEKEIERDSFEAQISSVDVTLIDEREKNLVSLCASLSFTHLLLYSKPNVVVLIIQQTEVERKANQVAARNFDLLIQQKQRECFNVEQEIKSLSQERDAMNADSHDRVVLSLKKAELESHKKKHRRTQVYNSDFLSLILLFIMKC